MSDVAGRPLIDPRAAIQPMRANVIGDGAAPLGRTSRLNEIGQHAGLAGQHSKRLIAGP